MDERRAPPSIGEGELDELAVRSAPHPLLGAIPDELRPWLLPVAWSQDRLWKIERPVHRVEVASLRWHHHLHWWRGEPNAWFQVTPAEFMRSPDAYPEHRRRVEQADLSYPLHAIRRRGRTFVLDGIHRLVRAHLLGLEAVDVAYLTVEDLWFIAEGTT